MSFSGEHDKAIAAALAEYEAGPKGPREMISLASPHYALSTKLLAAAVLGGQPIVYGKEAIEAMRLVDTAWDGLEPANLQQTPFDAIDVSASVWRTWGDQDGGRRENITRILEWALPFVDDRDCEMRPWTRAFLLHHSGMMGLKRPDSTMWRQMITLGEESESRDKDQACRVYRKVAGLMEMAKQSEAAEPFWRKAFEYARQEQDRKIKAAKLLTSRGHSL